MDTTSVILFIAVGVIALNRVVHRPSLVWTAQAANVAACIALAVWGLPGFTDRLEQILRIFLMLTLLLHIVENQRKLVRGPPAEELAAPTRAELDALQEARDSERAAAAVQSTDDRGPE